MSFNDMQICKFEYSNSNNKIILINIYFHLIRYAKISYEESTLSTPDQIWYDCSLIKDKKKYLSLMSFNGKQICKLAL